MTTTKNFNKLMSENQELRQQLAEAQETLRAIQHGEVDALVITTPEGLKTYTLSSAEKPYRLLIEEMKEGAVMLSDDNAILYCNKGFAEIVQAELDKLIGSNVENTIAPTYLGEFKKLLSAGRSGKGPVAREITLKSSGEKIVPTFVSINSLKTENITTTFLVITDLTKHMEDDLKKYTSDLETTVRERTNQLKSKERLAAIGQTAGMVGHDIRNPLQSIVSELYLLKQEMETLPENDTTTSMKESVTSIEEQAFYINKIIADLQDYTKPLTPRLENVNIADCIEDSLTSVVIPSNIQIEMHLAEDLKITSDSFFIKRILVNLISNALQAMHNGGRLTIKTAFESDKINISVGDTGPGIPDDVKPHIFEPLFTTKAKGQGLGLAVVKRLAEALNGTVTFNSQFGNGTTFKVTLPANLLKSTSKKF